MNKSFLKSSSLGMLAFVAIFIGSSSSSFGASTITIQNGDAAGVGFNDPTPVAPVGGNPGTTLGQQRLNAFQYAANIWGAILSSNSTITVRATWEPLSCTSSSAVLGSAGNFGSLWRDFPGAPFPGTWYGSALANALRGNDLDPATPEIRTRFNINLGNPGCLDGTHFYLGLDNNHGNDVDLVNVLLHEFTHGLGFQTFTNASTGVQNSGFPSVYDRFLFDNTLGRTWVQMNDGERQASAINTAGLAWSGSQVGVDVPKVLGTPRLRVNSPPGIAGNYTVGTASFGAPLSSPGVTADVAQASPTDGCAPFTNGASMTGRIALIDRGTCNFTLKVKNAQNAGAKGVIIANNVPGGIVQMGGGDATISIASVSVSQADGSTIAGQLGTGVNATMLLDTSTPAGVDAQGRPLMFAPNPFEGGSSVSHWDSTAFPNQLMEPNIAGDLTHSVAPVRDLTTSLLRDVGWIANPIGDTQFFVRQHYRDFLSREPDSNGLTFWMREITSCGLDQGCNDLRHENVSAAFFLSIEFQETGYFVYRMYKAAYGDISPPTVPVPVRRGEFVPDTQQIGQGVQVGVGNWQAQLEANKDAFAAAFVTSPRFTAAYPAGMSTETFVDTLNANAGGVLSQAERDQLITSGLTRRQILRAVVEDLDLRNAEFRKAFVLMQYFGYLRRDPDSAPDTNFGGYNFWLNKLNQFNGNFIDAEMVKAFIISIEYRQRFGP